MSSRAILANTAAGLAALVSILMCASRSTAGFEIGNGFATNAGGKTGMVRLAAAYNIFGSLTYDAINHGAIGWGVNGDALDLSGLVTDDHIIFANLDPASSVLGGRWVIWKAGSEDPIARGSSNPWPWLRRGRK